MVELMPAWWPSANGRQRVRGYIAIRGGFLKCLLHSFSKELQQGAFWLPTALITQWCTPHPLPWNFLGDSVAKTCAPNTRGMGSVPGQGTKVQMLHGVAIIIMPLLSAFLPFSSDLYCPLFRLLKITSPIHYLRTFRRFCFGRYKLTPHLILPLF